MSRTHMKAESNLEPPADSCSRLRFDPQGPDQIKMPRGRFTFAHFTIALLAVTAMAIVVLALVVG